MEDMEELHLFHLQDLDPRSAKKGPKSAKSTQKCTIKYQKYGVATLSPTRLGRPLVSNGQHLVDPPSPLRQCLPSPLPFNGWHNMWSAPKMDALCHEIGRIFSLLTDDEKVQFIFLCIISESQGDRLSVISVGGIG